MEFEHTVEKYRNYWNKPAAGKKKTVNCSKGRASNKDRNNPIYWSQVHVSNALKY